MRARYVLLAATLLAGTAGAAVLAQEIVTYDPRQLPAIQGKVAQYSLTPRGLELLGGRQPSLDFEMHARPETT